MRACHLDCGVIVAAVFSLIVSSAMSARAVEIPDRSHPEDPVAHAERLYPALFDRLTTACLPLPKLPAGAVRSPAPSVEQEAALFVEALCEEADYRVRSTVRSILSPRNGPVFSSDLGSTQIIDGDWMRIDATDRAPFKAICQLDCWFKKGANPEINLEGTGFFVGPRVLITNSHNVYRDNAGGWAKRITVRPGRNGTIEPFGSQTTVTYTCPGDWLMTPTHDFDMAWVILPDRTLYDRVKYAFSYKATTDTFLKTVTLNCSGYPDSSTYKYKQYYDSETKDQVVSPSQFKHWLDTSSGSSGSPTYTYESGTRYVVGVHCAHSASTSPKTRYNVATRMTKTYSDWTKDFIKRNP